ncbi:acyl-CoA thioesterase [Teichococcus vastitatis]|uniref:Acyl-CoA thioesterase n=1 Tax=Teichococcus vastitatis TaxID=2307076 RepID=A0ABS9W0J0_9PROT|nr:thioesterase family protein [Pseudoroseomonas vastitatis]MCI0752825.1 acyl-CoA thioesterase [Pseudoroseomonas vastitatis]
MGKTIPRRAEYRFFIEIPTRWADQDAFGHVNNAVYYTYYDTLVASFLGGVGLNAQQDGIGVVVETLCRHHSPAYFPDVLSAGLRVGRIGSSSVRYEIGLFRAGEDTACAEGHFIHVQVELANQHRTRLLPERLHQALLPLLTEKVDR